MRVSRVYVDQRLQIGEPLTLEDERAHYLGTVLRHREGDPVQLFNGNDGEFLGHITSVKKKRLQVTLQETVPNNADPALAIHIGVGLSRGERMDFIVKKCTELGASSIQPLFTERCEVKLDERRAAKRQAHWQKVAIAATEQSGRCRVPELALPRALNSWLQDSRSGQCLVLDPRSRQRLPGRDEYGGNGIHLLSGPEGGLSEEETDQAVAQGFRPVQLGPRILRTETAPVAALSILQYLLGDL